MLDESVEDARAKASAKLQQLREQGVLPKDGLNSVTDLPPMTPRTEDALESVVQGDILHARTSVLLDDESERATTLSCSSDDEEPDVDECGNVTNKLVDDQDIGRSVTFLPAKSAEDTWKPHQLRFTRTLLGMDALDVVSESTLRAVLTAHNKGLECSDAPDLLEGLRGITGEVIAFAKVKVPKGSMKDSRITFNLEGTPIEATYRGPTVTEDGKVDVFAVQLREQAQDKPVLGKLSRGLSSLTSNLGRLPFRGKRRSEQSAGRNVALGQAASDEEPPAAKRLEQHKTMEYIWSDINGDCLAQLDKNDIIAAMNAIHDGNQTDRLPQSMLDSLWQYRGRIVGLVTALVNAGTKKGHRLAFEHQGKLACTVYNGPTPSAPCLCVFVVCKKRSLLSGLSSRVSGFKSKGLRGAKKEAAPAQAPESV